MKVTLILTVLNVGLLRIYIIHLILSSPSKNACMTEGKCSLLIRNLWHPLYIPEKTLTFYLNIYFFKNYIYLHQ